MKKNPIARLLHLLLFACLMSSGYWQAAVAGGTDADMRIELIDLRNRPAAGIIPLLKPLLAPGGALSGRGFQLIVKTTPANLAQLRRVISRLDKRPRRLLIQVRFGTTSIDRRHGGNVDAKLKPGDNRFRARVYRTDERDDSAHTQQIRVLEGYPAFIHTGQQFPVGQRNIVITGNQVQQTDSIRYKSATTGFRVRAWVKGKQVRLVIQPGRLTPAQGQGGVFNTMAAGTTIQARLGEWITIGGTRSQEDRHGSAITYRTKEHSQARGAIQIRVIMEE